MTYSVNRLPSPLSPDSRRGRNDATDPELTYRRWQNRSTLLPYRSAVVRERSKEDRDEPLAVSGCELTLENCQRTLI